MIETWFVLEDETVADPAHVAPGKDGRLQHKDGRAVAYAPHGPRSRSVDADAERAKAKPQVAPQPPVAPKEIQPDLTRPAPRRRDMKPEETAPTYKTRSVEGEKR